MARISSLFILDPPAQLDLNTDTSLALMRESFIRGHDVLFATPKDLYLENGRLRGHLCSVSFSGSDLLFRCRRTSARELDTINILHMRKDPPVDLAYLHTTYVLDFLSPRVLQVNPCGALRNFCEKMIPALFPSLMPQTLATNSPLQLEDFYRRVGHMVIKPLGECSGRGIIQVKAGNSETEALFRRCTDEGRQWVQAQEFLPSIAEGDKRVLLLGGQILGWTRRIPAQGDFRSNVNAGGRCEPCELTEGDRHLCRQIAPWLLRQGIHLAGVDIVGNKILEINITSPSCLREINAFTGKHLERKVIDYLEKLVRYKTG